MSKMSCHFLSVGIQYTCTIHALSYHYKFQNNHKYEPKRYFCQYLQKDPLEHLKLLMVTKYTYTLKVSRHRGHIFFYLTIARDWCGSINR